MAGGLGGGEAGRYMHTHTRTCTRTLLHAPVQALSSARTQGRPVAAGMKPRREPLEEQGREGKSWKEENPTAERPLATDAGKRGGGGGGGGRASVVIRAGGPPRK